MGQDTGPFIWILRHILAGKKLTIVIVPDGARKVRQLKVRKSLLFFLFLAILGSGLLFAWWIQDYNAMKMNMPRMAGLEKENARQKIQLVALAKKIDQISKKMIKLKEFDDKLRTMVNIETKEDDVQFLGMGGVAPSVMNPDYSMEQAHREVVRLMHQSLNNLDTEVSLQTNEKAELYRFLQNQMSLLARTPSIWPTKGWVSSRFGYRISPFTKEREFHTGLDIVTRNKASIVSPADGIVASVSREYGYGNIVTINHGNGLKTRYAHLSKSLVKKGQYVKRGEKIALVGTSGRSTGPHLHYEVYLSGVPVNPSRYILN